MITLINIALCCTYIISDYCRRCMYNRGLPYMM